jgi:xylono-1,5-lactonase
VLAGGVWSCGADGEVHELPGRRFLPDGELQEVFTLPAGFVSSVCFGGPEICDVLISTADNQVQPELGGTLLRARSEVPRLALTPAGV